MSQTLTVFKKEFYGYFRSPVGYVNLAVFHLLAIGLAFYSGFYSGNEANLRTTLFSFMPWLFLFFIPATGMRLWAEEKRAGSIELLFTLPINIGSAVIGKFLAAWLFIGIGLLLTFSMALTTGYLGNPDWGQIFAGYLGCMLMAAAYLSISSVCSAITKNQVIAFVISVLVCFLAIIVFSDLVFAFLDPHLPEGLSSFLGNFSFMIHFQTMTQGLIEMSAISFFVTLTAAFLGINIAILKQ